MELWPSRSSNTAGLNLLGLRDRDRSMRLLLEAALLCLTLGLGQCTEEAAQDSTGHQDSQAESSYSDWGIETIRDGFETVNSYFDSFLELLGGKNGVCQYRCRYGKRTSLLLLLSPCPFPSPSLRPRPAPPAQKSQSQLLCQCQHRDTEPPSPSPPRTARSRRRCAACTGTAGEDAGFPGRAHRDPGCPAAWSLGQDREGRLSQQP